jgi:hypothetical protein
MNTTNNEPKSPTLARTAWPALLAVASAITTLHLLTNGRYGFHRDEFQFLSDALHLDWGFVAYPPMTPVLERILLTVFGLSMVGLRLFSVLAQAAAIVVTGLMARELGGGRVAQIAAALSIALSGLPLFEGTEFQYSSFDYLWWVLIAYFVIRLLRQENPRLWLAIGAVVGLGLLTKYSIVFFIAGILAGVVLSRARRYLRTPWFWAGIALAFLICLPNFLWQVRHDFISYHFLHHIHVRDVGEGRADGFLRDQIRININVFAAPLCLAGLIAFLRSSRYHMVGWMFVVTVALFYFAKGRGYYVAGCYPMVAAMGAKVSEQWLLGRPKWARWALEGVFFTGLVAVGAYTCAIIIPLASGGPLRSFALNSNGDLREENGWDELVRKVAGIRDSLPAGSQASLGIVVGNYGEQGAIELLGPKYHLPAPISLTNSAWLRGYPTPQPTALIVIGVSKEDVDGIFEGCRLAAHNANTEGVKNDESQDHPDIFVCGPPRLPWPDFWKRYQSFG